VNERLFSPHRIPIGVEHSLATGPMPCGLEVDMERARLARRGVTEILNSAGAWEARPNAQGEATLGNLLVRQGEHWQPALSLGKTLEGRGIGNVSRLPGGEGKKLGRELVLGTRRGGQLALTPALRKVLKKGAIEAAEIQTDLLGCIGEISGGGRLSQVTVRGEQLVAQITYEDVLVPAWIDSLGKALQDPPERRELPPPCRGDYTGGVPCPQLSWCLEVPIVDSPAHAWRRLGLIERDGKPTRRGIIFSFFQHGEGLAVAAALEEESYAIEDLVFDLANLRAGPRFAGDDSPYAGRLALACQRRYEHVSIEGYLDSGVPVDHGAGASEALRAIVEHGHARQKLLTESLRLGDIERALVEWRSLLRHIIHAPEYDWERWRELKQAAAKWLAETDGTVRR